MGCRQPRLSTVERPSGTTRPETDALRHSFWSRRRKWEIQPSRRCLRGSDGQDGHLSRHHRGTSRHLPGANDLSRPVRGVQQNTVRTASDDAARRIGVSRQQSRARQAHDENLEAHRRCHAPARPWRILDGTEIRSCGDRYRRRGRRAAGQYRQSRQPARSPGGARFHLRRFCPDRGFDPVRWGRRY